ncbi:MAG: hypothetical protein K2V38_06970, partial [Gemmataceae bacterium]|nr:hypothetical protein [Gemmataceae bacterium]
MISESEPDLLTPYTESFVVDKTQMPERLLLTLTEAEETSLATLRKTLPQEIVSARLETRKLLSRNGSPPEIARWLVVLDERRGDIRSLAKLDLSEPEKVRNAIQVCGRIAQYYRDSASKPEALTPYGLYLIQSANQVRYLP